MRNAINSRRWIVATGMFLFACLLAALIIHRRHNLWRVTPDGDAVFVSTRYITGIAITPDGTLWAGTPGGVLRRRPDGTWRRYTRLDGLASHEVKAIRLDRGVVTAITPLGTAVLRNDRWITQKFGPEPPLETPTLPEQTCSAGWQGVRYAATPDGLYRYAIAQPVDSHAVANAFSPSHQHRENTSWQPVAFPPSTGTHISALLAHGDILYAALFGDGLWAYNGQKWQSATPDLPAEAREITALAGDEQDLWLGTRRAGLWERRGGRWTQYVQPDEPISHNCQAIAFFRDALYVSTLEDGLAVCTSRGWGHFQVPAISSNAPRQMTVFRSWLYLRHGNGNLDRFDGEGWERNVGAHLPRRQVSAIAADLHRLYVAQWGGWSEFDGKTWKHFLTLPELQGVPITALYPEQDRLWIGTQGHGLAEYSHRKGSLRWHDERNGLPDDWVTTVTRSGDRLYAGTFVGGLAVWDGTRWLATPELAGENVTALEPTANGDILVATRHGQWRITEQGRAQRFSGPKLDVDPEVQCLCRSGGEGVWIGCRTGLFFIRQR